MIKTPAMHDMAPQYSSDGTAGGQFKVAQDGVRVGVVTQLSTGMHHGSQHLLVLILSLAGHKRVHARGVRFSYGDADHVQLRELSRRK